MGLPRGEMCGYLHVKVPAKVRGKGVRGWKAWKRKWVVVHGMTVQATKDPVVTIDMYSNESRQGQLERSTVYLEKVSVIRRTLSKTHGYAFTVEAAQEPLIHLAGRSETDCQGWISALRNIFWPPTIRSPMGGGIGTVYEVSIIENLSTFMVAGEDGQLPETVGYMMVLPSVILLTSLTNGSILIEWPWFVLHGITLINTDNEEDKGKIILVHIISEVPSNGLYYFFSEQAANIHQLLNSRLEELEVEAESGDVVDSNHKRKSSFLKRPSIMRNRKSSSDSVASSRRQYQCQQAATTTNSSGSTDEDSTSNALTGSQSLESITNDDDVDNNNVKPIEEPEIEVQLRRKVPMTLDLQPNYDQLPKTIKPYRQSPAKNSLGNRRISSSDSNLLSEGRASVINGQRQRALSGVIAPKITTDEVEDVVPEIQSSNNQRKSKFSDSKRPTSVHSSASHMSRDSGVMLTTGEDSPSKNSDKYRPADTPTKQEFYRPFSEFVDERAIRITSGRRRSSSASSDGTLYSEINHDVAQNDDMDPLYEDLDKFRKNINKLLGIQSKESPTTEPSKPLPPPLPPRQYERGRPVTPVIPVQLHRKDVMKYLGVEENTKKYGSLNRVSSIYRCNSQKRKDIHSFLGLRHSSSSQNLMTASQPSLLELTYDQPRPSFDLINSNEPERRISRTYVRARKPEETAVPPSPKLMKKKRIKFPKWRRSSMVKDCCKPMDGTYRSFEKNEWDDVLPEDETQEESMMMTTKFTELPIVEEQTPPMVHSPIDDEQYSVPRSRKSPIIADIFPNFNIIEQKQPLYANMEGINLSPCKDVDERKPSILVNDEELVQDDEYADMSVLLSRQMHAQSVYIAMGNDNTRSSPTSDESGTTSKLQVPVFNRSVAVLHGEGTKNQLEIDQCSILSQDSSTGYEDGDEIYIDKDSMINHREEPEQVSSSEASGIDGETSVNDILDVESTLLKSGTSEEEEEKPKSEKFTKEIQTQTSTMGDFNPEVIKKMIFECNPQGERLRQRLSSYIDEIFAESLMEYDSRRSSNISASSIKSNESDANN